MRWDPNKQYVDNVYGAFVPITQADVPDAFDASINVQNHFTLKPGRDVVKPDIGKPVLTPLSAKADFLGRYYRPASLADFWNYTVKAPAEAVHHINEPVLCQYTFDFDSSTELGKDWYMELDLSQFLANAVIAYSSLRGPPSLYARKAVILISGLLKQVPTYTIGIRWRVAMDRTPDNVDDSISFGINFLMSGSVSILSHSGRPSSLHSSSDSDEEAFVVLACEGKDRV